MNTKAQSLLIVGRLAQRCANINIFAGLKSLALPALGLGIFLSLWQLSASHIDTPLGRLPTPAMVWQQTGQLILEHREQRQKAYRFKQLQEQRNAKILTHNPNANTRIRDYTGAPTFFDQIATSLKTVIAGFFLASIIAIPLGFIVGLNRSIAAAANPIIQILKPISPLAWLPLVTIVVAATTSSDDALFERSFMTSVITVTLCSLWPTLINTSTGVANLSPDLLNVSRVLRLPLSTHTFKVVLPATMPMIFAGLRVSLGIAWMVLIAAEMLAQSPGLGKFVWDEFQNGSSNSLSRIMVAIIVIGFIGFLLDRIMLAIQRKVTWSE